MEVQPTITAPKLHSHVILPIRHLARRERASRRYQRLAIRPLRSVLRRDLVQSAWVRQRQDDGPIGPLHHLPHDLLRERARHSRAPDQNRRLDFPDHFEETDFAAVVRLDVFPLRIRTYELAETVPDLVGPERLFHEPETIEQVKFLVRLFFWDVVDRDDAVAQLARDAQACGPRAEDDIPLVCQFRLRDADRGHEACERHRAGSLSRKCSRQKTGGADSVITDTSSLNTAC